MMKMIFLLRCPKCRNEMKYQAKGVLGKQIKKCVYCGKAFKVRDNVVSKL